MPKTTGAGKLERRVFNNAFLPEVVKRAIIDFKNKLRAGIRFKQFDNAPLVLPPAAAGEAYYEYQVGAATAPTPLDPNSRGSQRIVGLVQAGGRLLKLYYTDDHYAPGSWFELQYP